MPIEAKEELDGAPAPENYIYVLYSAGLLKIGTTRDPLARFGHLRSISPTPVSLIWLGVGDSDGERALHIRFAKDRHKGEWFNPSDALRSFLAERTLQGGGMTPLERLAWAEENPNAALGP